MPDGTFKVKAARVELVQQTIKDLQDAAFYKTMAQEQKVIDRYIEQTIYEQKAKAGLFDRRAIKLGPRVTPGVSFGDS